MVWYGKSLGPEPVSVQCPLTSSPGEFPGYGEWLWYPGLPPVMVFIAFPFAFHISRFFSIHSSSPAIGFHSCFFFTTKVSAPIHSADPSLTPLLGEFPDLGLALVPNVVVPKAEQGCAWSRNLILNFCTGRGLNLGPCNLMATNVTTRLQRASFYPPLMTCRRIQRDNSNPKPTGGGNRY